VGSVEVAEVAVCSDELGLPRATEKPPLLTPTFNVFDAGGLLLRVGLLRLPFMVLFIAPLDCSYRNGPPHNKRGMDGPGDINPISAALTA
jgi:hypothetical protein